MAHIRPLRALRPHPDQAHRVASVPYDVVDTAEAADAAPESIRLFAGHSGWEEGQLEDEITSGDWFVLVGATDDILTPDPLGLWRAVFARQTGELRRYRSYPNDPGLN